MAGRKLRKKTAADRWSALDTDRYGAVVSGGSVTEPA